MWGLALAQRIGFHWDLFQMPGPVYCGDGGGMGCLVKGGGWEETHQGGV